MVKALSMRHFGRGAESSMAVTDLRTPSLLPSYHSTERCCSGLSGRKATDNVSHLRTLDVMITTCTLVLGRQEGYGITVF